MSVTPSQHPDPSTPPPRAPSGDGGQPTSPSANKLLVAGSFLVYRVKDDANGTLEQVSIVAEADGTLRWVPAYPTKASAQRR